jgi:hypothetical protein
LTRHLGEFWENQYQELRPVADLIQDILNGFNTFITKPLKWEPGVVSEEIQRQAKVNIKQQLERILSNCFWKTSATILEFRLDHSLRIMLL